MSVKEFVSLAEETKNPEKCFSYYSKNYEANKSNADFLKKVYFSKRRHLFRC
jgi:hypothetical protein